MDWWETPTADQLPVLRKMAGVKVSRQDPSGLMACMRLNHKAAPFDNPAIRRAVMMAVNQDDYMAAITGAVIAARRARTPVVLDGFASTVAAAVLHRIDPHLLDHCLVSHVSAEPGHRKLLAEIGKSALFDFGMRLGEASGAALALGILRAALACHTGMATFGEAGVSGKV